MVKFDRNCPECDSPLSPGKGTISFDSFPASYPVVCDKCDWEGTAHLQREIDLFNDLTSEKDEDN